MDMCWKRVSVVPLSVGSLISQRKSTKGVKTKVSCSLLSDSADWVR